MPTRAIGDLRLKKRDFNFHQFDVNHGYRNSIPGFTGPYITSEPQVQVHELTKADRYLIMASDGLWDELSRKTSAKIANRLIGSADPQRKFTQELMEELC